MPLFTITNQQLASVEQTNFPKEKTLQSLVEANLETVFNCRFVATEFPTGPQHVGRIDTLAISEDNNPVTIEYLVLKRRRRTLHTAGFDSTRKR